ncbi:taurine dioxygenase, 2-oxoglutarate-dependent [Rhodobacteraceae bacterium HTCC2150]|nr:taurine dioxygenase, 2-oxoglutarate-dependent [Rhodobacteraceae bacterium HTCC2150]
MQIKKITPTIGAELSGVDFTKDLTTAQQDEIYQALLDHQVIFVRGCDISPANHVAFAQTFGDLDEPNPMYPGVDGFKNIMLLENDAKRPPDTNSWHTDLTFKVEQSFASILVSRVVPDCGGDTLWSSNYAAYDALSEGMKADLEGLSAVHDLGDFRNNFAQPKDGLSGEERLNAAVGRMGHAIKPIIDEHPVTKRKFLNFNEAFITHIVGKTPNESNALRIWLANHMNQPEFQIRWRWCANDVAMWDNRVTMHYAVADYAPALRSMNRITVVRDRRS